MATKKESETLAGDLDPKLNDDKGNLCSDRNGEGVSVEGKGLFGDGVSPLMEVKLENGENDENEKEELDKKGRESEEKAINGDKEREVGSVVEHSYLVGEFIWGKIKTHPWWPGRIYDPSNATEFALRYRQPGRLLVVYFGDGSFSWCLPSQLKPFTENFEEMSKQSSLKTFLCAMDRALYEIGFLLEFEMTCRCLPQERIAEVSMPLAVNGGIKEGVLVPKGDIRRLSLPSYDPAWVLCNLRDLARTISVQNRLETVVLTSWVSAFHRAKGGRRLSVYCEPNLIEGLEDKSRNHAVDGSDSNVPVEVPIQGPMEEEWISYQNTVIADDKVYQSRKQKSFVELMGENHRSDVGNNSAGVAQIIEADAKGGKKRDTLSVKCSREIGVLNDAVEANEESEKSPVSRARKKSKYLSPPYTTPKLISGRSSGKREFDLESEKVSKTARVGERIMKVAAEVKSQKAVKEKVLKQPDDLDKETEMGKDNHEMILCTLLMNATTNQVLSDVQTTAINPLYLATSGNHDTVREFVSAFRKSFYHNEPNNMVPHKQSGKKRKLSEEETPKRKKSALTSSGRKKSPVSLMVTFTPGYPLPSKEEVIRTFSRYGNLNEKETNIIYNSNCVQVVYENGSDAEDAFKEAIKNSPFGDAHVNYRLRHSDASKAIVGSGQKVSLIKQNLNVLNLMLRKCNGKISQEEKFDLEGEIKGLLEKVSTMDTAP